MDILKAEIAKKRKLLEEKNILDPTKKYFKRGELMAKEQAEYLKKYGPKPPASEEEVSLENALRVSNENEDSKQSKQSDSALLPRAEVIRRLRERGHPILLFGENEAISFHRLRRIEIQEPEANKGFRNDFQEAMEKVDQAYLNELALGSQERVIASLTAVLLFVTTLKKDQYFIHTLGMVSLGKLFSFMDTITVTYIISRICIHLITFSLTVWIYGLDEKSLKEDTIDDSVTYDTILEMAKTMGQGDRNHDMNVILILLQFLLKLWGDQMNSTTGAEKQCIKNKMARATYTQTQVYLKPLTRKLRKHNLPEDICDSLTEITQHLLKRNYLAASDAYLQMAIGNAPWPIGVTMVGIHARTGREKIFSKNVAHVMNDETQRKYIQALKRLMTKCQEYFPTDPSRCVEYCSTK